MARPKKTEINKIQEVALRAQLKQKLKKEMQEKLKKAGYVNGIKDTGLDKI